MKNELNLEGANPVYLDWEPSLKIIQNKSQKIVLEFGCGFGTQILCNNFKEVYSFEVHGIKKWYDKTVQLLSQWDNWNGMFHTGEELGIRNAVRAVYSNKNNRDQTPFYNEGGYYDKLNEFVDLSKVDVAFVDHSQNMRAETVNYLMGKDIPVIFAHDTKHGHDTYGWGLVEKREDYEVVNINSGQGVTYWIKK
jgi:hypothetical protein